MTWDSAGMCCLVSILPCLAKRVWQQLPVKTGWNVTYPSRELPSFIADYTVCLMLLLLYLPLQSFHQKILQILLRLRANCMFFLKIHLKLPIWSESPDLSTLLARPELREETENRETEWCLPPAGARAIHLITPVYSQSQNMEAVEYTILRWEGHQKTSCLFWSFSVDVKILENTPTQT